MSDKAAIPAIDPADRDPGVRSICAGLLGVTVFLVGGIVLTKVVHEALGIFEWLRAAGAYWNPFFPVGHSIVAIPLFAVRTRNWLHWMVFLVASMPFAAVYSTAGIAAALVQIQLPWGPPMVASLATFLALTAPVMIMHMRLFDRPPASATGAMAKAAAWGPWRVTDLAALILPGLLLLAAFVDLVDASGLLAVDWTMIGVFALFSTMALVPGQSTSRRRLVVAAMNAGAMVGGAMLTVAAMLLVALVSSEVWPANANIFVPLLLFFLVYRLRSTIWRRLGLGKPR